VTRLSICVPTWNGAAHLRASLASLLAQTVDDFEIVVGDDASDDRTCAIVREIGDCRVRLHAFPDRQGLARNWNRTLRLARGEYVAVVGQDDAWSPDWAASLLALLDAHPEADLAFCRRRIELVDEESRRRVGDFFTDTYPRVMQPFWDAIGEVIPPAQMLDHACRHRFELNLIGEPSFVMFRRDSPAVDGGYDEALPQLLDWEFCTRFFVDRPILHCARELGTYRLHGSAASIDNASRSYYPEVDHLLGIVLRRFDAHFSDQQRSWIVARREELRARARDD
jgi:glycosyltransferase involved in cell wall biosynthesis